MLGLIELQVQFPNFFTFPGSFSGRHLKLPDDYRTLNMLKKKKQQPIFISSLIKRQYHMFVALIASFCEKLRPRGPP